jgi:hypothetical protein
MILLLLINFDNFDSYLIYVCLLFCVARVEISVEVYKITHK